VSVGFDVYVVSVVCAGVVCAGCVACVVCVVQYVLLQ